MKQFHNIRLLRKHQNDCGCFVHPLKIVLRKHKKNKRQQFAWKLFNNEHVSDVVFPWRYIV